jgi:hypothetical protein
MAKNKGISIPSPQRDTRLLGFPPIIKPDLRDIPEYDGPFVDSEAEVVESDPVPGQRDFEQMRRSAEEAALNDERVQQHLRNRRYEVIGLSLTEKTKRSASLTPVLIIYVYDDNTTLEVTLDGDDATEVKDVVVADYQPAPTDAEIERAVRITRGHRGVADNLHEGFEEMAILASAVDPGDQFHGRRCFAVGFGPADERLPRIRALVDLSRERVLGYSTGGE